MRLNNLYGLHDPWVIKEIREDIKKSLDSNGNEYPA
jgi:hypothetical protein